VPVDDLQNLFDLVAWIHHQPFPAAFIAKNRAVALQRADRQNLVDHKPDCILKPMGDVPAVIMRWLHLASVATLVGGFLFGSLALRAAAAVLPPEAAASLSENAAARFRPWLWLAITALILSGIYNVLTTPGHTTRYYVLLAIKLLLVAHVFAAGILAVRPQNPHRARQMTGAFISGFVIILISAYLRRIF